MRVSTIVTALKRCTLARDVEAGKIIHAHLHSVGFGSIFVENTLIHMYSKCGSMLHARLVFDNMPFHDEAAWNALLLGYVDNGECQLALRLFHTLLHEQRNGSCTLNARTYMAALTACVTLAEAQRSTAKRNQRDKLLKEVEGIHSAAFETSCSDIFVETMLINLYAKLGCIDWSWKVFSNMTQPNVVTWTALLQGYVENGESIHALELYDVMNSSPRGCLPNPRTYSVVISACATLATIARSKDSGELVRWLEKGQRIHEQAVESRCCGVYVNNALINMYAAGVMIDQARQVFDRMSQHNVVSWNSLLQGYTANGLNELALEFFYGLGRDAARLMDPTTFVAALTACSALAANSRDKLMEQRTWLDKGRELHARAVASRCCNVYVETTLIKMFGHSGSMPDARDIFNKMSERNVVSWTALIQAYVENGEGGEALEVFNTMEKTWRNSGGCSPNSVTFAAALQACVVLAGDASTNEQTRSVMERGRALHSRAVEEDCCDLLVETSLMNLYAACGSMTECLTIFDRVKNPDIVCWNTLLQGYVVNGESQEALKLFDQVQASESTPRPNHRTYLSALTACASLAASTREKDEKNLWLERGREIHSQAEVNNCCDVFVENALVDMYSKCGSMVDARRVFERMNNREEFVCWSSLIRGYVENGENEVALELVSCMFQGRSALSCGTSVPALMACGSLMSEARGKEFHGEITRFGLEQESVVATGLVEFYGRCGSMEVAKLVFDSACVNDNLSWNSLLGGYSQRGDSRSALELFETMKEQGLCPDKVTLTHVLAACSHAGLTERGLEHFNDMVPKYGIKPDIIHYNCVVDLLARANLIDRALEVVRSITPNAVTWNTLLGACKKWNNLQVGELAYRSLVALGGREAAGYNLMANIYTNSSHSVK